MSSTDHGSHEPKAFANGYGIFLGVIVWWALWGGLIYMLRGVLFGVGNEDAS